MASSSEDEEPKTRKTKETQASQAADGTVAQNGDQEKPSAAKKKHDRYNLKRVKKSN